MLDDMYRPFEGGRSPRAVMASHGFMAATFDTFPMYCWRSGVILYDTIPLPLDELNM